MVKWERMWVLPIGLHWTGAEVGVVIGAQVGVQTEFLIGTLEFLPEKVNIRRISFITEFYFNSVQIILIILNNTKNYFQD